MSADPKIHIRLATAADIPLLLEGNLAMALETENLNLDPETLRRGVTALFKGASPTASPPTMARAVGFYSIAERSGEAAGQMMVTEEWSDWRNATWWWIQSVYVWPRHRRQGIYRALHRDLLERARQTGGICGVRLYVEHRNAGAQETYEALGMYKSHYEMFEQEI